MEKMLVVVFESEPKAYEGSRALAQLDAEGSIAIYAESVIKKNGDGTVTVKQLDGDFPVRTVGGTAIGSLVGLLGGPVGMGVGRPPERSRAASEICTSPEWTRNFWIR